MSGSVLSLGWPLAVLLVVFTAAAALVVRAAGLGDWRAPVTAASQVLDPVLDGVGNAVPPVKPVTDAVKDLLGRLGGGG